MDRRQSIAEQLEYYQQQVRLARLGLSTRRPLEFLERQIQYLTTEGVR